MGKKHAHWQIKPRFIDFYCFITGTLALHDAALYPLLVNINTYVFIYLAVLTYRCFGPECVFILA